MAAVSCWWIEPVTFRAGPFSAADVRVPVDLRLPVSDFRSAHGSPGRAANAVQVVIAACNSSSSWCSSPGACLRAGQCGQQVRQPLMVWSWTATVSGTSSGRLRDDGFGLCRQIRIVVGIQGPASAIEHRAVLWYCLHLNIEWLRNVTGTGRSSREPHLYMQGIACIKPVSRDYREYSHGRCATFGQIVERKVPMCSVAGRAGRHRPFGALVTLKTRSKTNSPRCVFLINHYSN